MALAFWNPCRKSDLVGSKRWFAKLIMIINTHNRKLKYQQVFGQVFKFQNCYGWKMFLKSHRICKTGNHILRYEKYMYKHWYRSWELKWLWSLSKYCKSYISLYIWVNDLITKYFKQFFTSQFSIKLYFFL